MFHEDIGIHDGDQLMEEIRLGVKQLRSQLFHYGLQLLGCRCRHSVPSLRFTPGEKKNKLTLNIRNFLIPQVEENEVSFMINSIILLFQLSAVFFTTNVHVSKL